MKYIPILLLFITTNSWAIGTRGGGKGIVCRDNKNKILTVEVLDLWEAHNLNGKQIVSSTGSSQKDLDLAIERSRYIFSKEDDRVAWWLSNSSQSIFVCTSPDPKKCPSGLVTQVTGIDLPLSNDSFEGNLPLEPGCKVEQIIEYIRPQSVGSYKYIMNMDLVSKMDAINIAALSLHEGIYSTLVSWDNDQNSQRVRRIVGHIMSGGTFSLFENQLEKPYIRCAGSVPYGINDFYFAQDLKSMTPKVTFVAQGFAGNQLINFNETQLETSDLQANISLDTLYKKLKSSDIKIKIQGTAESIEFLSALRFEVKSGIGILNLDRLTGGGPLYAPIENITCDFIK